MTLYFRLCLSGLILPALQGVLCAQHIDHHNHVMRDSHGHVIGTQHHDVIHNVPHYPSSPITHVDQHQHIIRDSHGHQIGVQRHEVLHSGSHIVHPGTIVHPSHVVHPTTIVHPSHVVHPTIVHHPSWSHHLPSFQSYTGQYYEENGNEYYIPSSPLNSNTHVVAKPAVIEFGGYARYQDLSGRLETLSNELLVDLHYNYSHNPGFKETYRETYQLLEVAKFIHAADHNRDGAAMREKLAAMDPLFHHVQGDVKGWSRIHKKQVGTLGIATKIEMIEATLHHLMNDIGVPENPPVSSPNTSQPITVEQAPPPTLP